MKCKKMGNSKDKACLFGNRKGGQEQYALPDIPTKIEGLQSMADIHSKASRALTCPARFWYSISIQIATMKDQ